jgi:hypothetical protein
MTIQWIIGIATVGVAGFVRGFSGFGSAMVIIPVLSLLFGVHEAASVSILTETVSAIGLLPGAVQKVEWKAVLPMALTGIVMVPLGAYTLAMVEPIIVNRSVSIIVMMVALLMLAGWQFSNQSSLPKVMGAGAVSGILTGIGGMGGPPAVLYFLSSNNEKVDIGRANCIIHLFLVQIIALGIYVASGLLDLESFKDSVLFLPPFMIGIFIGNHGFQGVDSGFYRKSVLVFLLTIGLSTLVISR